ncbi:MAG: hypothetical protein JNK57_10930 [Planctomycetaceae bacterium]|nr:hypothetical protein [Planctomycetaceae bacterium]
MSQKKILVQWIGHADLRALATNSSANRRDQLLGFLAGKAPPTHDLGPTKTLLATQRFDEIRLLTNYPHDFNLWFAKWLGGSPVVREVTLNKPTDYAAIFQIANQELESLKAAQDSTESYRLRYPVRVCSAPSSNTPSGHAIERQHND